MKRTSQVASLLMAIAIVALAQVPGNQVNWNKTTPTAPLGTYNARPAADTSRPSVNASMSVIYPTIVVACPTTGDLSGPVENTFGALNADNGGIIDARACTGATTWAGIIPFDIPGVRLLLPCTTISASNTVFITAGTRNVTIEGCGYQGGSQASSENGGTIWIYNGNGPAFEVGDPTYSVDTVGFRLLNMEIFTYGAGSAAQGIYFYRTQEIDVQGTYFNGNGDTGQTAITLDGTGNYTGGYFANLKILGYGKAVLGTGHLSGSVVDDYANASTFTKLHVVCPTSGGSPISGTYGIDIAGGDANTFVGGDIEGCNTALALGANATNNTFTGVRTENYTTQIAAASGSSYNDWIGGGALATTGLTDAGTHNSFADAFHAGVNHLNGDLYRSQVDTTVTNHIYAGIGVGNVRGLIDEYETDVPSTPGSYQATWQWGPGDGTTGLQVFQLYDLLNSVPRFAAAQYTTAGGNNQTIINSAGSGAIVLNASTNAGTGGIVIDNGGATPTEIAAIDNAGNQTLFGELHFFNSAANQWSWNCASTTVCELHNDAASTPANVFRAFPNAATEIDSQGSSDVEINATSTGGTGGFTVYGGGASYHSTKYFAIQPTGSGGAFYLFPTLAAGSGHDCLQVDNSGYVTNTGAACGTGSGSGTVNTGTQWSPAYYATTANAVSGVTPFSGLEFWPGGGPPAAATAAQVVAVISTTPVADATYAATAGGAPPTGSAGGDLSGSYPNPGVAQINGTAPPTSTNHAGYNASGQPVASPNTLGCIDGYDHLPCVVFQQTNQSITATQSSYAQVWPASGDASAGIYRASGYVFATAAGTCTGSVSGTAEMFVKATQNGGTANGWAVSSAQIAATSSSGSVVAAPLFNVAASTTGFNVEVTLTCTGSVAFTSNPTVSYALTIERIQ